MRPWLGVLSLRSETPTQWLLWGIAVAACILRFVGLEHSPPGFFSDELRGAWHQICLGQTGQSGYGERWPGFVPGAGGGLYTPPFLYLGMLWIKVFGPSIASSRSFVALFGTLAVLGIVAVAVRVAGFNAARWVFLAAALSPWAFQFARIAWDPALAPAFLVWAVFFWLRRANLIWLVASAVCFTLALYVYPPFRIQAPIMFAALMGWALFRKRLRLTQVLVFAAVALASGWPLIRGTLDGTLNGRGSVEGVWAADFVNNNHGRYPRAWFVAQSFVDNLVAHFRPSYLFMQGDGNFRHSTQWFGELGLIDDLALGCAALAGLVALWRRIAPPGAEEKPPIAQGPGQQFPVRALTFAGFGFLCGLVPAALCWSGVPHALRSEGSWPFLALGTGITLHWFSQRWRVLPAVAIGVAVVHAALFSYAYIVKFPEVSDAAFDGQVKRAFYDPAFDPATRAQLLRDYPEGFRYYAIVSEGETCNSSVERVAQWAAEAPSQTPPAGRNKQKR